MLPFSVILLWHLLVWGITERWIQCHHCPSWPAVTVVVIVVSHSEASKCRRIQKNPFSKGLKKNVCLFIWLLLSANSWYPLKCVSEINLFFHLWFPFFFFFYIPIRYFAAIVISNIKPEVTHDCRILWKPECERFISKQICPILCWLFKWVLIIQLLPERGVKRQYGFQFLWG